MKSGSSGSQLLTRRRSDVEISRLAESMHSGNLSDRAQVEEFEGPDRELLEEINSLLDALTYPLQVATDRMERMAGGEIPPRITEHFSGDLEQLKDCLNVCIDSLRLARNRPAQARQFTGDRTGL
jgi:methyl-accepting chemotaxis protein